MSYLKEDIDRVYNLDYQSNIKLIKTILYKRQLTGKHQFQPEDIMSDVYIHLINNLWKIKSDSCVRKFTYQQIQWNILPNRKTKWKWDSVNLLEIGDEVASIEELDYYNVHIEVVNHYHNQLLRLWRKNKDPKVYIYIKILEGLFFSKKIHTPYQLSKTLGFSSPSNFYKQLDVIKCDLRDLKVKWDKTN